MGGFTLPPSVFQCFHSKSKKKHSLASRSETNSIAYRPDPAKAAKGSVCSSTSTLASTSSSSSQQQLLRGDQKRTKHKITYNTSAFTGPTVFSAMTKDGCSPSELADLQTYRFAGR